MVLVYTYDCMSWFDSMHRITAFAVGKEVSDMSGHPEFDVIRKYNKCGYKFKTRTVKYKLCLAVYDPQECYWFFSDINTDELVAISEDFEMTKDVVYISK